MDLGCANVIPIDPARFVLIHGAFTHYANMHCALTHCTASPTAISLTHVPGRVLLGSQLFVSLQQLREQVESLAGESGTQRIKLRLRPQCDTQVSLLQSTEQLETSEPPMEQITSTSTGTTVAACAAFLGTLFCFWQPQAVDRVLVPFGDHSSQGQLRLQHERAAAVDKSFCVILVPCFTLYRLYAGMWLGAVASSCFFAFVLLTTPNYKLCLNFLDVFTYVGVPILYCLLSLGIVQGDGWALIISVPSFGLILHDLPSQQLRTSLFVTAVVSATLADPMQVGFSALVGVLTTCGVLIKRPSVVTESQGMQDSHLALCLATLALAFLATCRLLKYSPSTIYNIAQNAITIYVVTAAALVGTLFCFWKPQAVDNLLVPFGIGYLDEVQLRSRNDRVAAVARWIILYSGPWIFLYHLSFGCWMAGFFTALIVGIFVFIGPSHRMLLITTNMITFGLIPIVMVCVRIGLMKGSGWPICVMGPIVGGVFHHLPSRQLGFTLFYVVLFMIKGDWVQCATSVALMLTTTAVTVRTTSTLLQEELREKLDRVKLEAVT